MLESARRKHQPPSSSCTGSSREMVTEGGEVGFVSRIVDESLRIRDQIQWYSSMLGFLSSLTHLVDKLRSHGIHNYAVTEFVQGNKTRRWAIGWTFGPMRPAQAFARGTKAALSRKILPAATEVQVVELSVPADGVGGLARRLHDAIAALELMSWEWNQEALEGVGRAAGRVWGRAWRRRRARAEAGSKTDRPDEAGDDECQFGFKVKVRIGLGQVSVSCRWMEGFDGPIFESFQGFVKAAALAAARADAAEGNGARARQQGEDAVQNNS